MDEHKKILSLFGEDTPAFHFLNQKALEYANSLGYDYEWKLMDPFDMDVAVEALNQADVGIIDIQKYDQRVFERFSDRLKLLVRFGVGFENVDLDAATKKGIAVARTTGANTIGVAEMAVSLMLTMARKLRALNQNVEKGVWQKDVAHELYGSTVGIVGFGSIGQKLAAMLKGFDCEIIVYDPFPNEAVIEAAGVKLVSLDQVFQQADFISIHAAATPENYHMVDAHKLDMMKPNAILVNTSRGTLVDECALADALDQGKIGGAALDVLEVEPASVNHPLLHRGNVMITSHASSQTYESLWRIYQLAIEIADDVCAGRGSRHVLNPEVFD